VKFGKARFSHGDAIRKKAEEYGHPLDEYTIQVNGDTVLKPYKDQIYDANGKVVETLGPPVFRKIEFKGNLLAWSWFIPCKSGKSIVGSKNPERKIRLRKCNIQIGFEDFLDRYFPEPRSNGYMIGEIHLVSDRILPNGDRNGLDVSREAAAFIRQLEQKEFKQLWQAAREANTLSAAEKQVRTYETAKRTFEELQKNPGTPEVAIEKATGALAKTYEAAKKGAQTLHKAQTKSNPGNEFLQTVVKAHADEVPVVKPVAPTVPVAAHLPSRKPDQVVSLPKTELQNAFIEVLSENAQIEIGQCMSLWKALDERLGLA
jgi:hypothetical protein